MLFSRSLGLGIAALAALLPVAAGGEARPCANDAGLSLPAGFCATVFADKIGRAGI